MKHRTAILALITLAGSCFGNNAFYVWQQAWTSNTVNAVCSEPQTTMYPLVTVVPEKGLSQLTAIPWQKLRTTPHCFVPVIRVPLNAFNRTDLKAELARICGELPEFDEIQIDLDCPESRLEEYAKLLAAFRESIPGSRVSITALPSHLGNKSFRILAELTDYYVLQIHGLDVPKHIDIEKKLMDPRIAKTAIKRAEALQHPYSIALPCYAYELNFDPDSGDFLYLAAERAIRRQSTIKKRFAADYADLIELLEWSETLNHAQGLIWFRLPVRGDRLCLPRAALACIEEHVIPMNEIICETEIISTTTLELSLRNISRISTHSIQLKLDWENPRGNFDLYAGVESDEESPGRLPDRLTVPVPPPGESVKIGWFTANTSPQTRID